MSKKKVCIVGLGGVGGYVGCILAHNEKNVYFFARGERLKSLQKNGLNLYSDNYGEFTVHPTMASSNAEDMGVMDYIILSVKNFSLEEVCAEISPMIGENTLIIPLLNGVGVSNKIRSLIHKGIVLDGLVYITSGSNKDFSIHHTSPYCKIHIGYKGENKLDKNMLLDVQNLLQSEFITCTVENDIEAAIWKKYILNCAFNVATAYYNSTIENIRKDETAIAQLKSLLDEACAIARSLKVNIPNDLEKVHLDFMLYKQSPAATSSLNRDIAAGRQNELEIFSGHLLKLASKCGIQAPITELFYKELKNK